MNFNGWQGNFLPNISLSIAAGATESSPLDTKGMALVGFILPSIFTGTALSFLCGDSEDGFQANGEILFGTNPAAADTLTLNGVVLTFVAATPGDDEILVGAAKEDTMANLQAFLDDTDDDDLLALTYSSVGALMTVTAKIHGTDGNAYTFAKSSSHITLSPSGGTLTGGGFRPLYNSSNAAISLTVAAGRAYGLDPAVYQSIQWLVLKSGTSEANDRTILVSVKGL